ncbi:two-component system, chemotaxis family, response regulator CheB [Rhizobium sp. NFR07]|uniref:chemotaxis protein CheB n=1 Tax=Rhizobium sp. NFR07 TaxID=1566262 RepID=UPI0008E3AFA3|nr:chemotaxis protein CheB [Rhizobium sp. NFR07]SFB64963.1 two-component system, chemotaxis family, response regulator CheB [Rhizobium sp. NFR07]
MIDHPPEAVVIGASAGAIEALSRILPLLPSDFKIPILVVVHVPPDKRSALTDLFEAKCRITVLEVEDKEPLRPGTVYFAPPDYHLLVEDNDRLALSSEEPVLFSRPSIDVLFDSAADVWGERLIGIILTGANQDGSHGLRAVGAAGGTTIVQDPNEASAPAMPEAAIAATPTATVMSLNEIAAYLLRI